MNCAPVVQELTQTLNLPRLSTPGELIEAWSGRS